MSSWMDRTELTRCATELVLEWNFHHDVAPEGNATGLAMTIGALLSVPSGMKVSFAIQEALLRLITERQHVFRLSLMVPVTLHE